MYKIKLACEGISEEVGRKAASDVTREFASRPWQNYVLCSWDGSSLLLQLENGFDENGLASVDEFSAAISACVEEGFEWRHQNREHFASMIQGSLGARRISTTSSMLERE